MITGIVREDKAWIRLTIRGPTGNVQQVTALVDTGYTGWLTLPTSLIDELDLPWQDTVTGILADGSEIDLNAYEAAVIWDRRVKQIRVEEADVVPLVGMSLMRGFELKVKVRPRGKVTLKRLP
jgi:clan AA aspartic protease